MEHRIHQSRLFGSIVFCALVPAFLQACDPFAVFPPPLSRVAPPSRDASPAPVSEAPRIPEPKAVIVTESRIQEQELESVSPSRSPSLPPHRSGISVGESPASKPTLSTSKASPKESRIQEMDLRENTVTTPRTGVGGDRMETLQEGGISTQPAEDPSLIAKITPSTAPQSALSLRLAEEGRRLIENHEYEKALAKLEKAIAVDSRNRFGYYYLARAHYHLGDFRQSLNFLDIVEPILVQEPNWLARVFALKGKNYDALGSFGRADESYAKALRLDMHNQEALEGLSRIGSR